MQNCKNVEGFAIALKIKPGSLFETPPLFLEQEKAGASAKRLVLFRQHQSNHPLGVGGISRVRGVEF
jgi:hypothetical protein